MNGEDQRLLMKQYLRAVLQVVRSQSTPLPQMASLSQLRDLV